MRDLKIGDEIVSDETGALTKFVGWMEYSSTAEVDYLELLTEDGEELILTETHNVFFYDKNVPTPTFARNLRPGNVLVGRSGKVKCS